MQFTRHVSNTIVYFMEGEKGASPTEYVLVASLAAVILGLALLAMHG